MLPCGCARGHCEAADAADCRRIQASVVDFDTDKYDHALAFTDPVTGIVFKVVRVWSLPDAVNSGREKLTC